MAKKRYFFIAFMKILWALNDFPYGFAMSRTLGSRLTVCWIADVFVATTEAKLGQVFTEEDDAADLCVDVGCALDE